jgi:hypothetical protein
MHSTPKLWSYIGFDVREFGKLNEKERNRWARTVDMFLRHSKDYPLSLFISLHVKNCRVYEQGFVVIESLFAQSPRWRSATLRLGNGMLRPHRENSSRKLSILWPSSLPQLESLGINGGLSNTISSIIGDHGSVLLPSLKRLHIDHLAFQEFQRLSIPFSQIRSLTLPLSWSRQAVLQTLRAVPLFDCLQFTLGCDSDKILTPPMKVSVGGSSLLSATQPPSTVAKLLLTLSASKSPISSSGSSLWGRNP